MESAAYIFNQKKQDFYIVTGVKYCTYLGGFHYTTIDRTHRIKGLESINSKLISEDIVRQFDIKKMRKLLAEKYKGCTLMTCDQPSLLIED